MKMNKLYFNPNHLLLVVVIIILCLVLYYYSRNRRLKEGYVTYNGQQTWSSDTVNKVNTYMMSQQGAQQENVTQNIQDMLDDLFSLDEILTKEDTLFI